MIKKIVLITMLLLTVAAQSAQQETVSDSDQMTQETHSPPSQAPSSSEEPMYVTEQISVSKDHSKTTQEEPRPDPHVIQKQAPSPPETQAVFTESHENTDPTPSIQSPSSLEETSTSGEVIDRDQNVAAEEHQNVQVKQTEQPQLNEPEVLSILDDTQALDEVIEYEKVTVGDEQQIYEFHQREKQGKQEPEAAGEDIITVASQSPATQDDQEHPSCSQENDSCNIQTSQSEELESEEQPDHPANDDATDISEGSSDNQPEEPLEIIQIPPFEAADTHQDQDVQEEKVEDATNVNLSGDETVTQQDLLETEQEPDSHHDHHSQQDLYDHHRGNDHDHHHHHEHEHEHEDHHHHHSHAHHDQGNGREHHHSHHHQQEKVVVYVNEETDLTDSNDSNLFSHVNIIPERKHFSNLQKDLQTILVKYLPEQTQDRVKYAVAIVSFPSIPVFLVLFLAGGSKRKRNSSLLNNMISFSFGTILGDVFFHLLPSILHTTTNDTPSNGHEHHIHEHHGHPHVHDLNHSLCDDAYFLIMVGILIMVLIELIVIKLNKQAKKKRRPCKAPQVAPSAGDQDNQQQEPINPQIIDLHQPLPGKDISASKQPQHEHHHDHDHSSVLAFLFSDLLHNFTDGIALGTTFVQGIGPGISTTIAIMVHEIPHEIGDFSFMLKKRRSIWTVLITQLATAIGCYLGGMLGVIYAAEYEFMLLCFTCGAFMYVALSSILGEVKSSFSHKPTCSRLIQTCLSTGLGLYLMFIVGQLE